MIYRSKHIEIMSLRLYQSMPKYLLSFPVNINKLTKYINSLKNVRVYSYQELAINNDISVSDIVVSCNSKTGCVHRRNNNYIIMYNNDRHIVAARKVFTILHEIGHIILRHFYKLENQTLSDVSINNTHSLQNKNNKNLEKQADYFAACCICPMPIVRKFEIKSQLELKNKFKLSNQASEIAWKQYNQYDKIYNIAWHNDFIRLFNHLF